MNEFNEAKNEQTDRIEEYTYFETILENIDVAVDRIEELEIKDSKNKKQIKRLMVIQILTIGILIILLSI